MVGVEAAILLPVLFLIVGLVIVLGRDALAEQAVGSAAASAARAASIERSTAEATAAATSTVTTALRESSISCSSRTVSVDAAAVNSAPGTPAAVSVTVQCLVQHDVTLPGFPNTSSVTATRSSPVDTYRSN
ncbi:pilus assembly protein [Tessaracoccus sp. OS52]|uniref:TadE/TadG family type IV pilus assembly protein n=1 Tax=Tessaracoccus sp. OS52 TaxID=2886691 RepID=UPI001D108FD3|nr:TadE/TadG family type IV pilus assembly protein [Tessaracoccus sp. OS52]MCC2592482.1 pilus assembly protein [Tessaracoccus sp. OS52]